MYCFASLLKSGLNSQYFLITDVLDYSEKILTTFPGDTKLVFTCHHGNRSLQVAKYFKSQGFVNSLSIFSGIEAWSNKIDP